MIAFSLDVLYLLTLLLASPWLMYKAITSGKYRHGWLERCLGSVPRRQSSRSCVWFHAVSVGEVLLLRRVIAELASCRPDLDIVLSTTTNTGMEVARQHYPSGSSDVSSIFYFPLDFSWAVHRAISRVRPDVIALAELELWPNFIRAAKRSGATIAVINGRMSPRSFRGYSRIRLLVRSMLRKIDHFALQTHEYSDRFTRLGATAAAVSVTGSVKYDGVGTDRDNPATTRLRSLLTLDATDTVWVAGSTSEPEEEIVLDAFRSARTRFGSLRLILVPRHKERFDEVGRLIESRGFKLVRRSRLTESGSDAMKKSDRATLAADSDKPVMLVDTLGELSAVWGLADIAFVGGSFAPRGGQNMIEPAAYGAAVMFGPGVWNFQDTVNHLLARNAAIQLQSADELVPALLALQDKSRRATLGAAARAFVLTQQGATKQTVEVIESLLSPAMTSLGLPRHQAA